MEILLLIAIFAAGFFVGEAVTIIRMRKTLHDLASLAGIDLAKELTKSETSDSVRVTKIPRLVTEVHGDIIYLYDKESDDFICQANNINELASLAKERKNILAAVVFHGDRVFAFHNGTAQEAIENSL